MLTTAGLQTHDADDGVGPGLQDFDLRGGVVVDLTAVKVLCELLVAILSLFRGRAPHMSLRERGDEAISVCRVEIASLRSQ
jgi:hypothetical protein